MKLLCLGVFLGGVDAISASFLDAIGRPDLSAKLSIVELLVYIPILYLFLLKFGVSGAATAWAIRMGLDYAIRSILCLHFYLPLRKTFAKGFFAIAAGATALCIALIPMPASFAVATACLLITSFYGFMWFFCFNPTERDFIHVGLTRIYKRCRNLSLSDM